MKLVIRRFLKRDDGAVSVDFVALTAGVAGLGVAVLLTLAEAAEPKAGALGQELHDLDFEAIFANNNN